MLDFGRQAGMQQSSPQAGCAMLRPYSFCQHVLLAFLGSFELGGGCFWLFQQSGMSRQRHSCDADLVGTAAGHAAPLRCWCTVHVMLLRRAILSDTAFFSTCYTCGSSLLRPKVRMIQSVKLMPSLGCM